MRYLTYLKNPSRATQIVFLVGICLVLFFANLGQWDLWNPDEPKYAQVAKEMVSRGDWVLMHFNGQVYGDKPPLFFWLIGISSYLWQGFSSFSVRFPSALFGTLTVLLTFFLGERLYSSRAGFFSALILATSLHFAYLSTRANIDATLTFFTTASLLCFYLWHRYARECEKNGSRHIRNLLIYGFYVSMAFATLTKGPIGFVLPLLVSLIYLFVQKDRKEVKRMKLVSGVVLLLIIVLAWYVPAVLSGGKTYVEENLFKHTTQAYAKGWTHPRPIYYYLYSFPVAFLPWIFFLPSAIACGRSQSMVEKRREFLFLLVWVVVIFAFFSLSKSKRTLYLLPLYPAASLIVGKFWDDFLSRPPGQFRRGWVVFPLYGVIGLCLMGGIAGPLVASIRFSSYLPYSLPVAFLLAGGGAAMLIFCVLKKYKAVLVLLIGMMIGGYLYTFRVVFPLANSFMSARFLSEEITSRIQPGEKLAVYRGLGTDDYNYHTGIVPILRFDSKEALLDFLSSRERVFCLLKYNEFSELIKMENKPMVQWIAQRRVRKDDVVLISNR
jgi:4-amino-4-deoxy-L-arabinose transferase-like glycosyltransferase